MTNENKSSNKNKYPDTLIDPPDGWGDFPGLLTIEEMEKYEEWYQSEHDEELDADEAEYLDLEAVQDDCAIYSGGVTHDGYHRNCRAMKWAVIKSGESYAVAASHDPHTGSTWHNKQYADWVSPWDRETDDDECESE